MKHLPLIVMTLALGGPLLGQAPSASYCQMKVVSADESPAHLPITVTNINQASVVMIRAQPELDFKVRVISDTGREVGRVERGRRSPTDPLPLVSTSITSRCLKTTESFQENLDLSALYELKPGKYNVYLGLNLGRTVYIEDKPVQLTAAVRVLIP